MKLDLNLISNFEKNFLDCSFCSLWFAFRYSINNNFKTRLNSHVKKKHFWCYCDKVDHYIRISAVEMNIEWDREPFFVLTVQSDKLKYLKSILDEDRYVYDIKSQINISK